MRLAPLHLRPIRRLLCAYGVNQLGDWTGELALAVVVYASTGSAAGVALVWVAHRAVLAPLAPLLVARLECRVGVRALPAIQLVQGALFGTLAATAGLGLAAVLPLVVLDGLLAPTARALARGALVGVAQPAGLLRETNALVNVIFTVNGVLAPLLGGLLVAAVGAETALVADALSFVVAALALRGLALKPAAAAERSGLAQLRAALAHVRSRVVLRGLLVADAASMLCLAALAPVEIAFVTETLGQGEAAFGAMLAAWGVGMVVGGAATAALTRLALPALLGGATLCLAGSCLGVGVAQSMVEVLAWSVVGGIGNGAYGMAFVTALQERTADRFQTCVGALYETLGSLVPGVGFVAGGVLAAAASPRAVYLAAGAGTLVALACAVLVLRGADWSCPRPQIGASAARG